MDQIQGIIRELKNKDYQHFDMFYHLTKKQVFFAIITIVKDQGLAEDLLQETYMKFLEKIHQFKPGMNPYAYLSTIGRHLAIDLYHKRKKEVHDDEIIDHTPDDRNDLDESDDQNDIMSMVNELEPLEKEIVLLHVVNELKFREIAKELKKPIGTVLWIYQKAIKKLQKKVGDQSE